MANCTDPSTAAKLADSFLSGGYDDWFLPSQGELELVYTNLYAQGLVTLGNYYWSSSENNGGWEPQNNALYRSFVYNFWTYDGKNGSRPVRAVRAF
jgi:hypothetical protein